jgi:exopolyphosphatase/guanosine-5'-triphosphate,3'-diphosphate pyrophosphatase
MSAPATSKIIAAVDLGSNSFHMIVAQIENEQMQVIDRLKEMVRLGAGLTKKKHLTHEASERALDCLSRFGQRLRDLPAESVRVVGTNTLRQVRDGGKFLRQAQAALGHRVEIIAGREEARLVYLGVAHGLAADDDQDKRLVVDIGGGSTELIIGQSMEAQARESLFMGCVSYSQRFFPDGKITEQAMNAALIAGRLEIRPYQTSYHASQWVQAVGSSGSIKSIRDVVQAAGWSDTDISRKSLKKLRKTLVQAGHIEELSLEGLSDDRKPVFAGGVAVLSAVFQALDIAQMRVSDLALREGLLFELLGSIHHHDVRDRTVDTLVLRYSLDDVQGQLVATTAASLLSQVQTSWDLAGEHNAQMLNWAARLHEIGLAISHGSFHKHGAYILAHADMPGFSRQQQKILSPLVGGHRRKLTEQLFHDLPKDNRKKNLRLCIILRISVLMHRGRSHAKKPALGISVKKRHISLSFPSGWLAGHPLTKAELAAEAQRLESVNYLLDYV